MAWNWTQQVFISWKNFPLFLHWGVCECVEGRQTSETTITRKKVFVGCKEIRDGYHVARSLSLTAAMTNDAARKWRRRQQNRQESNKILNDENLRPHLAISNVCDLSRIELPAAAERNWIHFEFLPLKTVQRRCFTLNIPWLILLLAMPSTDSRSAGFRNNFV